MIFYHFLVVLVVFWQNLSKQGGKSKAKLADNNTWPLRSKISTLWDHMKWSLTHNHYNPYWTQTHNLWFLLSDDNTIGVRYRTSSSLIFLATLWNPIPPQKSCYYTTSTPQFFMDDQPEMSTTINHSHDWLFCEASKVYFHTVSFLGGQVSKIFQKFLFTIWAPLP